MRAGYAFIAGPVTTSLAAAIRKSSFVDFRKQETTTAPW